MEQPGFRGTGRLQQEQELATPHLWANCRGCETKRQSSGVTESWSFKRLLLRGFLGPEGEDEWAVRAEREAEVLTSHVREGHGGRTRSYSDHKYPKHPTFLLALRPPAQDCAEHGRLCE